MVRIDHVIWTTADLERTAESLAARYGLRVSGGGRHEGHGTHNLIVPLGGGFLELLALEDPRLAASSPIGRALATAGEGLFGWVVAVEEIAPHAERLGLDTLTLTRGATQILLAGVAEAMSAPWLPFFIERPAGSADPGAGGTGGGIASLEVRGDRERLSEWLDGAELPLELAASGEPGVRSVRLGSGVVLGGADAQDAGR